MKKVAISLLFASFLLLASCEMILFSSMDDLAPATPANVRLVDDPLMSGPPKLAWDASEGAAWYVVYAKYDLTDAHVPWSPEGQTTRLEWNMAGGGYYAVVAVNGFGSSALSAPTSDPFTGW
ncbi:MAG: hypothetical protein JXA15_04915 [Spirochaetales bacterium]|nr:hypothetical protein [Spirochaetales bacterium]